MNNYPYYAAQSSAQSASLISKVSYLLCTALLATAATAYWLGPYISPMLFLPIALGTLGCVFALRWARSNAAFGLILLYVLSVLEGALIGPMLISIAHGFPMGSAIIAQAATLAAVIMAGCGSYVWVSNQDFSGLGKYLFIGLIGLLVVGVVGIFVNFGHTVNLAYSVIGALIFTGFTLYDFSNIKKRYGPNDYVVATVNLYLDFLNLFMFLLRILLMMSGGGGSRRN